MVKRGLIVFLMSLNIPLSQKLRDCAKITMFHQHFLLVVTRTDLSMALLQAGQLKGAYKDGIKDEGRREN